MLAAVVAAILQVGSAAEYPVPSAAARVARDGDTVEIAAGTYRGDVCAWTANDLTIRGAGRDATVVSADGRICRGKAVWVVTGTNVTISCVSLEGARCADRNGAGIRFEGRGDLTVRGCAFHGNENGFLSGALPEATIVFEDCDFSDNGSGDGYSHNLYVGAVKRLVFRDCRSGRANRGHALKSRAHETVIEDSVFDDTAVSSGGKASSYLVDCPNGGCVTLRDCRLHQSADAANGTMVSIGEEGAYPGSTFVNDGNTFVNDRSAGCVEVRTAEGVAKPTTAAKAKRVFRSARETMGSTNLIPVQEIDEAAWIWCGKDPVSGGTAFVRFRRRFESDGSPLTVDVSADERFVLTMDGEFVGRGPHRGFVDHWNYQTYQLSPSKGGHVLEATVASLGAARPAAQTTWRPGFALKASGSYDAQLTTGRAEWQAAVLKGTVPMKDETSGTIGLVGGVYRVTGASWLDERPDDSEFAPARIVRGPVVKDVWGGRTPGWMLFPSTLPDQRETVCSPGRFVSGPAETVVAMNALLAEGKKTEIPSGSEVKLLWDLGDYYCAYPELSVSGGNGAEILWSWDESLRAPDGSKGDRREFEGKAMTMGFGDEFVSDGRSHAAFTTPWWRAGRWCELTVRTKTEPIVLTRLAVRETRYPLAVESSFASDDAELGGIAALCRRTMENCTHETLCDCPHWEQLMYSGDTRVELQILSALSADERIRRTAISLFDQSRRNDGLPAMAVPLMSGKDSSTYALCWVMMFGDYARWGTDPAWLKAHLPGMRAALDCIARYEDDEGLVSDLPGWNYVDERLGNYGVPPGGLPGEKPGALVNLQYLQALQAAADAESAVDETIMASRWREKAERVTSALRVRFPRFQTAHELCLAVITGVIERGGYAAAAERLADFRRAGFGPMGAYFQYYLFDAAFRMGRADLFFDHLDPWRKMLAAGLVTATENGLTECRSDCHAWSAGPLYFLHSGIAGVRPTGFFWSAAEIAPQPGPLTRIVSDTPTPRGAVRLDLVFKDGGVKGTVEIPSGLLCAFVWNGSRRVLTAGRNQIAL